MGVRVFATRTLTLVLCAVWLSYALNICIYTVKPHVEGHSRDIVYSITGAPCNLTYVMYCNLGLVTNH